MSFFGALALDRGGAMSVSTTCATDSGVEWVAARLRLQHATISRDPYAALRWIPVVETPWLLQLTRSFRRPSGERPFGIRHLDRFNVAARRRDGADPPVLLLARDTADLDGLLRQARAWMFACRNFSV